MTIYKVTSQKKDAEIEFTFEADTPLDFFKKANYACQKNNVLRAMACKAFLLVLVRY